MADEAREYIRAAQQAELRGDKPQAVDLLVKAAALYRQRGQTARALQMLRYASRLDATRTDLADEVRRMEWMPEKPFLRAVSDEEDEAEERKALSSLDDLEAGGRPGDDKKQLIERGPTRADPALNAWCSFCCRPKSEVGDLIAGPAGAFVCLGCLKDAAKLLGWQPAPGAAPAAPRPSTPKELSGAIDALDVGTVGQEDARRTIESALKLGVRCALLVGPEGSGKSAFLQDLSRRGMGGYYPSMIGVAEAPDDLPLLIDHLERATPEELIVLGRILREGRSAPVLLAVRGILPPAPLTIAREGDELPVYPASMIATGTGGKLPSELIERVQTAASFGMPTRAELIEIARRLAVARASELDVSDDLFGAIADVALASGRLGHEVKSILTRLPPGEWTAKVNTTVNAPASVAEPAAEAPPKKRGGRRKKGEPAAE
jgi:hypothetical protein